MNGPTIVVAAQFPAVVLTGPRQSGKTTLLKHVFGEASGYVSREPPDVRAAAAADPRGFLELHPAPVIFDEVQQGRMRRRRFRRFQAPQRALGG
jgi:predicted AAA+ superfamily ATPase